MVPVEDKPSFVYVVPGLHPGSKMLVMNGGGGSVLPLPLPLHLQRVVEMYTRARLGMSTLWFSCASVWLRRVFAACPDVVPWTFPLHIPQYSPELLEAQVQRIAGTVDTAGTEYRCCQVTVVSCAWVAPFVFLADILFEPEHVDTVGGADDLLVLDYGSSIHTAGRAWCVICGACYPSCSVFLNSACCRDVLSVADVACASTTVKSVGMHNPTACAGSWVQWAGE
jgi:hypothetical protein